MRGTALRGAVALLAAVLWPLGATGQSRTSQSGTSQTGGPTPLIPPSVTLPMGPQTPTGAGTAEPTGEPPGEPTGAPIITTPLPPPTGIPPSSAVPGAAQVPAPVPGAAPAGTAAGTAQVQPQAAAPAPESPPRYPNTWIPQASVHIQVLDKIDALAKDLSVKVGQSVSYGALTIGVQSCVVRPPDQPADAAAFLVITDSHKGEPGFRGWSLAHEPWLSMLQNPIYDVRVVGCGG